MRAAHQPTVGSVGSVQAESSRHHTTAGRVIPGRTWGWLMVFNYNILHQLIYTEILVLIHVFIQVGAAEQQLGRFEPSSLQCHARHHA
jgi:hypothetical protein